MRCWPNGFGGLVITGEASWRDSEYKIKEREEIAEIQDG